MMYDAWCLFACSRRLLPASNAEVSLLLVFMWFKDTHVGRAFMIVEIFTMSVCTCLSPHLGLTHAWIIMEQHSVGITVGSVAKSCFVYHPSTCFTARIESNFYCM